MHSAKAMFGLVNDVCSYPKFLPWCTNAKLISHSSVEMVASLKIAKGRVGHNFTTKNQLSEDQRIEMELIDGPFKYLKGVWQFKPLHDHACKVTLDLDFEFSGRLTAMALGSIFNEAANTMVDAFCKRANEIYG
ncbi:MAG: type II toxin-antitoxin system RatA family toxin [Pseudomonadales bacterium]|nr:type II toxin-antitoxin system RatA family toxin [Pseudomonadales bacterium]